LPGVLEINKLNLNFICRIKIKSGVNSGTHDKLFGMRDK
jgi:hypothetical protein